ncbi:MAG TPA: metal-dependent transcriptional regulator [Methanospirillum sp.]|nr:metal-dependent transcriptional regulator [Methanospirillum sp.]
MEIPAGLELSPRKVDYLKFIFQQGNTVKTNDIASHFAVDPSTITKTISELADIGYLTHIPYRGVVLTDTGKRYATFLVKRHRILSLILVHNGLSEEQACSEVTRFESFVTQQAIDIMCCTMGHPQQGVCGMITHDEGCRHATRNMVHNNQTMRDTPPGE